MIHAKHNPFRQLCLSFKWDPVWPETHQPLSLNCSHLWWKEHCYYVSLHKDVHCLATGRCCSLTSAHFHARPPDWGFFLFWFWQLKVQPVTFSSVCCCQGSRAQGVMWRSWGSLLFRPHSGRLYVGVGRFSSWTRVEHTSCCEQHLLMAADWHLMLVRSIFRKLHEDLTSEGSN